MSLILNLIFLLTTTIPFSHSWDYKTFNFTSSSSDVSGLYAFNSTYLSLGLIGISSLVFLTWAAVLNFAPSAAAKQDILDQLIDPSGFEEEHLTGLRSFSSPLDRFDDNSCDCHNFCVKNLDHYALFARPKR